MLMLPQRRSHARSSRVTGGCVKAIGSLSYARLEAEQRSAAEPTTTCPRIRIAPKEPVRGHYVARGEQEVDGRPSLEMASRCSRL